MVHGFTLCTHCQRPIKVTRALSVRQAQAQGYDAEYDGQYLDGACPDCHHRRTPVYIDDVRPTPEAAEQLEEALTLRQHA